MSDGHISTLSWISFRRTHLHLILDFVAICFVYIYPSKQSFGPPLFVLINSNSITTTLNRENCRHDKLCRILNQIKISLD
uniref:Uncharacterized protein n=1 Tax=Lepeophtheirus salmonis TaxID=72036 RepID=A0A0K2V699_LEPSM